MLQFAAVQSTPSTTGGKPSKDAAYWLDFAKNNSLGAALNATFDSGQGDLGTAGSQDYFVPTACAVCHGGSRRHAALNVMDTDHWFERVRQGPPAGIDFPTLSTNVQLGVLLDAGPTIGNPQFKAGFDVLRTLNTEVLSQNGMSGAIIQRVSTKHWVDKHASSDTPLSLADRSLGASPWTAADSKVLGYLDRYCYRCHNAIAYNVFDKNAVLVERPYMIERLQLDWSDPNNFQIVMPQDRHLDPRVTQPFVDLLNAVK
jgi:cytochrome c5